jgi:hypothetical protein
MKLVLFTRIFLNIWFNYVVLGLYLRIVAFSNISVMESWVHIVCVTYTTAGQLTQLRGSTRGCPILYLVSGMATVCVDRSAAMFKATADFRRRGRPRGSAERTSWLWCCQFWLQLKLMRMEDNLLSRANEISDTWYQIKTELQNITTTSHNTGTLVSWNITR